MTPRQGIIATPFRHRLYKGLGKALILTLILGTVSSCEGLFHNAYVGPIEANHPWFVFPATLQERFLSPYADRSDPWILYLVLVGSKGDAFKVNLRNKKVEPWHFPVDRWEDVGKLTNKYSLSDFGTTREEFQGTQETKKILHWFGFPYATKPGTTQAIRLTGNYYILDHRGDTDVELLRVRYENAEPVHAGELYRSPDNHWLVFHVDGVTPTVFVFNREDSTPAKFAPNTKTKVEANANSKGVR